MFLRLFHWSDFQDFLFVAKKLLKSLQALGRAKVSFSYSDTESLPP